MEAASVEALAAMWELAKAMPLDMDSASRKVWHWALATATAWAVR